MKLWLWMSPCLSSTKKPVKRGYKVWVLADKTGYAWKFEIYTGKNADAVERNLGERVVKILVQDIKNKNHRIYFDNFFTSVGLMQDLKQQNIHACGTVNQILHENIFHPCKMIKK